MIPTPDELIQRSSLQKAMLFELSMARAESQLGDDEVALMGVMSGNRLETAATPF